MSNKDKLEEEKLKLEIKKLKTPAFRDLELWKILIPTLAILVSLYYTFGKGLLDSEKSRLELQKDQLKLEITQFEMRKTQIEDTTKIKDIQKNNVIFEITKLEISKDSLIKQIINYKKYLNQTKSENYNIKSKMIKDKSFYQGELKKEYELEEDYLKNLNKINEESKNKQVALAKKTAEANFLRTRAKLTDIEKIELDRVQLEAASDEYNKFIQDSEKSLERIHKKYEEKKKKIDGMSNEELMREFELQMLQHQVK